MSTVTKPIALDESFNTTGQTPKNIADVIKNGLQEVAQAIDSHQGGGGHVILDQNGNALDQEPNMQFVDAHTSDDSVNTTTKIENIKPVTRAQFDIATEDGFYEITDEDDATMEEASADYVEVTADGNTTWESILNYLFAHADLTKIQPNTNLCIAGTYHPLVTKTNVLIAFSKTRTISSTQLEVSTFVLQSSGSYCNDCNITSGSPANATITDNSSNKPSSGAKITLYYGTNSCVTNLINQAKYTYMESGESVESALTYTNSAIAIGKLLGRTLYRKVFEFTEVNVPVNTDVKLTGAVGIDSSKIISISTVLRQSGKAAITNSPVLQTYITSGNEMWINQGMSSSYNNATITIIVEYTD